MPSPDDEKKNGGNVEKSSDEERQHGSDGSEEPNGGINHEDGQEKAVNTPISNITPDAIAEDGVLSFLKGSTGNGSSSNHRSDHHRSLSAGSRAQIDAHLHQRRFLTMRQQLSGYLEETVQMIKDVISLNGESSLSVIPTNLSVLGVDVRLGAAGSVSSSVTPSPSLVESRLQQVVKHAQRLQNRLSDTTSRVLVTGDLNAGKSSLCNALLRRSILPVDQQPCTDVFCEVIDYEKNHGVEEVHAVRTSSNYGPYDRDDRRSYDVFSLSELERLVHASDQYKLLVVYLRDPRPSNQSLLNNGVVDICLIDAPGLNVSAVTTTELFGRQEEIDLVIFVVSAENHFTQSAKEFVSDTAREKSLLFIAVNNFDRIRDKDRCRARVLDQVAQLAPETHKGASDFVHFVSASPPDNDPENPGDGGDGRPNALDELESSLRNFVLDKRSESKLQPARTYLRNVLSDLTILAAENQAQAEREISEFTQKLDEIAPSIDKSIQEYAQVSDQIDRDTERLCHSLFAETDKYLSSTVTSIGETPLVEWPGLWHVFDYAAQTRSLLVQQVVMAVEKCEEQAREKTASAVDGIKQVGVLHVGEQPAFTKVFNQSAMFSRRKDNLRKLINADFGFTDLFDIGGLLERPLPVLASSKRALVSTATSNASVGSAVGGALTAMSIYQGVVATSGGNLNTAATGVSLVSRLTNAVGSRKLVIPTLLLASVAIGAWVIYELPRTIPRKLARKIAFEIDELGYVRSNADRISAECRKVLKFPAQDVRAAFQTQLESRTRQRDEFENHLRSAEHILSVFDGLATHAAKVGADVSRVQI